MFPWQHGGKKVRWTCRDSIHVWCWQSGCRKDGDSFPISSTCTGRMSKTQSRVQLRKEKLYYTHKLLAILKIIWRPLVTMCFCEGSGCGGGNYSTVPKMKVCLKWALNRMTIIFSTVESPPPPRGWVELGQLNQNFQNFLKWPQNLSGEILSLANWTSVIQNKSHKLNCGTFDDGQLFSGGVWTVSVSLTTLEFNFLLL